VHVEYDRAVELAFTGGVLGDVGNPQLVRLVLKLRSTRSAAKPMSCRSRRRLRPGRPTSPARRISSSTAPCPTGMPSPRHSSACTWREP
jgi:hypothetical protein